MDERLRTQLERSLGGKTAGGKARPTRQRRQKSLLNSAQTLFLRATSYARRELPEARIDRDALETACLAVMMPFAGEPQRPTAMGVLSLSERCTHAAELLLSAIGADAPEELLDRTVRILLECPRKATTLTEARVLTDAINIEDFGISGICRSAALLLKPGEPVTQLADAYEMREQYGYWEARLNDSFHFSSTRALAEARLRGARNCIQILRGELQEDLA